MDPNAAKVVADYFALAHVDPDTELDAQFRWRDVAERDARPHSAGRPVEDGENAIAGGLYDAAPVTANLPIRDSMVAFKDIAPPLIADRRGMLGRPDDVSEHNGRQYSIARAHR
jgi:hypothetical protein